MRQGDELMPPVVEPGALQPRFWARERVLADLAVAEEEVEEQDNNGVGGVRRVRTGTPPPSVSVPTVVMALVAAMREEYPDRIMEDDGGAGLALLVLLRVRVLVDGGF